MANRFLNNIRINDAYTFPASDGNDGQVITTDGAGNLAFENISPDAASVIYRDNFTGDGSTATFDLQNSITDEDQTQIYIDGVYQEKSTYSISGTTITFTTAPILGHSVEVISISSINTGPTVLYQDNFTGNGNDTAFTLGQIIDNEIKTFIFLNGVYQFKNTYTVDGTTLTFDTAPANGVAIEVVSIASAVQSDSLEAGSVIIPVKNTHTASISKGTPVYITGNVGASERLQIAPADASNSAKMPAAGLLLTTLAVNAEGYVITGGYLRNLTTDTIDSTSTSSNDTVYVKAGGGLTMTKPTGSNLIQNIAKVARSASGNSGSLLVSSILRTNDIPNLTTGKIWVGSANNTIESGTLHLDESNNRLGINNTSPSYSLDVTGDANISSNVIVGGNLTVQGTETILNTQTVEVEDNILQLNTTQGSPDTATATTSGISIYRGNGVTQASFIFDDADDTWDLTNNLVVAGSISTNGTGSFGSTSTVTDRRFQVTGSNTSLSNTTTQFGIVNNPTYPNTIGSNIFNLYTGPNLTSGATLTNLYNLYLESNNYSGSTVTNSFALYQAGSSDKNYFAGNVGIGTTSPGQKLSVSGNISTSGVVLFDDGNGINFGNSNAKIYGSSASGIQFNASGSEAMRLNQSGNLGIGHTSPTSKLSIVGDGGLNTYAGVIGIENTDGDPWACISLTDDIDSATAASNYYLIGRGLSYASRQMSFHIPTASDYGSGAQPKIIFASTGSDTLFSVEASTGTAYHKGNVGIGTTNPANGKLEVQQTATTAALWVQTGGTTDSYTIADFRTGTNASALAIKGNGNVGIGTTNPSYKLEVNGGTALVGGGFYVSSDQSLVTSSTYTFRDAVYINNPNSTSAAVSSNSVMSIGAMSGNSINTSLITTGAVGIGTSSPGTKLEIYGNTSSGGFGVYPALTIKNDNTSGYSAVHFNQSTNQKARIEVSNSAGSMGLYTTAAANGILINSSGNVGIGTSPSATLDVQGTSALFITRTSGGLATYIENDGGYPFLAMYQIGAGARVLINTNGNSYFNGGNVGIGTSTPSYKLDVESSSDSVAGVYIQAGKSSQGEIQNTGLIVGSRTDMATNDYLGISFTGNAATPSRGRAAIGVKSTNGNTAMDLVFMTRSAADGSQLGSADEKMRITSAGRVLMLGLDGKTQVHPDVSYRTSDGELFYQTSSERYKTDIVNLESSLNKVNSLRPVRFIDINTNEPGFGLIAEETNEVIPDVVFSKNDQIEGISYSNLTPFLIKAIQELKAEVETLKNQINGIN